MVISKNHQNRISFVLMVFVLLIFSKSLVFAQQKKIKNIASYSSNVKINKSITKKIASNTNIKNTIPFYLQDSKQKKSQFSTENLKLDLLSTTFKIVTSLAVVIGLVFALSWFIQKQSGFNKNGVCNVINILPLGNKKFIYTVEVANKILIIGVTEHHINTLCEINDPLAIKNIKNKNIVLNKLENNSESILKNKVQLIDKKDFQQQLTTAEQKLKELNKKLKEYKNDKK